MEYIPMHEVQRHYRLGGGYWFEPSTMRSFASRVAAEAFCGPGGIFFTTSERCSLDHLRLYSVRQYNPFTRDVDTIGDFQAYKSNSAARRAALRLAGGN